MGAWAVDAFGNDHAADWAYQFEDGADLSLIEDALDTVIVAGDGYVEAPEACEALAAAEAVARLQGNGGERSSYSKALDNWIEQNPTTPSPELAHKAHAVIESILGPNSELKELWQDSEEYDAWLASVGELKARIHV